MEVGQLMAGSHVLMCSDAFWLMLSLLWIKFMLYPVTSTFQGSNRRLETGYLKLKLFHGFPQCSSKVLA
jgi:hypothetical protein